MSEQLLERFEEAWQDGNPPSIEDLLASAPETDRRQLLEELVKIDLEYRWRAAPGNSPPLLETYTARHPALGGPDRLPVELIAWEYLVRRRYGDRPKAEEYKSRFAGHGEALSAELQRVDDQLAAEFSLAARKKAAARRSAALSAVPSALLVADLANPIGTIASLIDALSEHRLLTAPQLKQLDGESFPDPRALGRALIQRGWLTPYQLNQLFRGKGAELRLGAYLLLERLGEGAVGQVFKAHHQKLDRVVALKVIRKDLLADEEVIGRFYREMEIVGQLSHPNIVQAYDAGPVGATHVLVMEYVEGTDLARQVRQHGPLPVSRACDYIRQAAGGLAHAHTRGLIHRDIKPSNLLLSFASDKGQGAKDQGQLVKILDMGLARLQWTVSGEATNMRTPIGAAVIGTPDYLAPEQALDFHAADIRSDIYSLGCTFFYLLTGQPPFPGGPLTEKLLRHQQADPPAVESLRPEVSPAVAEVLSRMLAKRPAARYQTPTEVAEALTRATTAAAEARPAPSTIHKLPALPRNLLSAGATGTLPASPPRPKNMLHRLLLAAAGVVAAGLLLAAILPRWPAPPPVEPLAPAADLEKLAAHFADSGITLDQAWSSCQAFRQRHPGTPEEEQAVELLRHYLFTIRSRSPGTPGAAQARTLLHRLPWPMDRLQRDSIPPEDRPPRAPPELVGVFGKRGRPPLGSVAVHPDGLFVAGGGFDHSVRLWDASTGREVRAVEGLAGPVRALAFSPDGLTLAAGLPDGSVKTWDVATGKERLDFLAKPRNIAIIHLAYSPDSKTLAIANAQGAVLLWTVSSPKDRMLLPAAPGRPVHDLAYSPDGRFLAAAVQPNLVKLWEVPVGKALPDLKVPGAHAVAFTPDSRSLAVGVGGAVKLYAIPGRTEMRTYRAAHPSMTHSLAFTPDGNRLVNAGSQGLVLWWDAASAREQGRRTIPGEMLRDADLAPDGRHLVVASKNGTVYVLRLPSPPR